MSMMITLSKATTTTTATDCVASVNKQGGGSGGGVRPPTHLPQAVKGGVPKGL